MADLIDRQAAIDALDGVKVDEEDCTEYDIGYNDGIDFAVSKLSVLPSADAVEVVRCKGCKHYRDYGCQRAFVYPKPDDFCSYGERADG